MVIWWKHVTMRAYVDFIAEALGVDQLPLWMGKP